MGVGKIDDLLIKDHLKGSSRGPQIFTCPLGWYMFENSSVVYIYQENVYTACVLKYSCATNIYFHIFHDDENLSFFPTFVTKITVSLVNMHFFPEKTGSTFFPSKIRQPTKSKTTSDNSVLGAPVSGTHASQWHELALEQLWTVPICIPPQRYHTHNRHMHDIFRFH